MFNISDRKILSICSNHSTFMKAKQYYFNERVKALKYHKKYNIFTATVVGSKNYSVEVEFDSINNFSDGVCTCPAYERYYGHCKHIGAVLFEIADRDKMGDFDHRKDEEIAEEILEYFDYKLDRLQRIAKLEITYEFQPVRGKLDRKSSSLSFSVGESRLYKLRDIKKLLESMKNGEELVFGKKFTFDPYIHTFKEVDASVIDILKDLYESELYMNETSYGYYRNSFFNGNKVYLTNEAAKRFFQSIKGHKINVIISGKEYKNVEVIEAKMPLDIVITRDDKNLILDFNFNEEFISLVDGGEYFWSQGNIYILPKDQREKFMPFYKALEENKSHKIKISKKYSEKFVSRIYPHINEIGEVQVDKKFEDSIYKPGLKTEFYLDKGKVGIDVNVKFVYGNITINPFSKGEQNSNTEDKILIRDIEGENEVSNIFEEFEFRVMNEKIHLDDENKIFDFIYTGIPKLQDLGEVYYSENFKALKIKDVSSFMGGVRINNESNMLEFDFGIKGIDKSELKDLFDSFNEKKKYYKLKDGSFLPLDIPELEQIQELIDYLNINVNDFDKEVIEIPKFRALYLDEYIRESKLNYMKRELKFKELVQNIKEPGDIDYTIPKNVEGVLREYQKFGFKWLKTLSAYGFGGILADDMGLGKTLQVLSFLTAEKEEKGTKPSLIVAPTSLVYNWASEVEKFCPSLKTLIISGSKDEREMDVEKVDDYDLVITSYPLIRRDAELYEKSSFRYCILDEAQHIKNPMSVGAKSVKTIKAENYFALTGTPIENSLTELWSIFDFIMPGYLLSYNKFKKRFETPIVKNEDKKALEELKRHIHPFILRRLKRDVLKELPEKIESKMVAELSKEQKKVYLAYLEEIKGEIDKEIKSKGFNRSHIKILAGLTRLRQICCDPALFLEDFKGESGKLSLLEEIIDDALDSNHRILLFSQFTSMLAIIKKLLDKKAIEYKYLDGSIPIKEREIMVREFNEGSGDIFLISLKAGGTGLNLTGADMVIHYDPWWNPAVEDQATDRAYRIGQKNSVQVIKLITKGTIEERIYELQERKRKMVDSVIKPGETLVTKLTEEEIKSLFQL